MPLKKLDLKSSEELKFIGEGNEHIVFALSNTKLVLRVKKVCKDVGDVRQEDFLLQLQRDIEFINEIVRPLAGCLLVDEAYLVQMDTEVLDTVVQGCRQLREEKRLFQTVNPFGLGVVTPNLAFEFIDRFDQFHEWSDVIRLEIDYEKCGFRSEIFPYSRKSLKSNPNKDIESSASSGKLQTCPETPVKRICIELKPKQGFLETGPKGSPFCRFCMKQYIKVKTATENRRSGYCPQDLFSGDEERMKKSISRLFEDPQNNLKIFKDGKRIKNVDEYRHFDELLISILKREPASCEDAALPENLGQSNDGQSLAEAKQVQNDQKLLLFSFLGRLLYLQRLGNIHEVNAAVFYREMQRRIASDKEFQEKLVNFGFLKRKTDISDVQKQWEMIIPKSNQGLCDKGVNLLSNMDLSSVEEAIIFKMLQECFISMSAKDASLMILIDGPHERSIKDSGPIGKQTASNQPLSSLASSPFWKEYPPQSSSWYKCQISLVDIALKDPKKVLDHEIKLGEMEDIFLKLKEEDNLPQCCLIPGKQ